MDDFQFDVLMMMMLPRRDLLVGSIHLKIQGLVMTTQQLQEQHLVVEIVEQLNHYQRKTF